MKLYYRVLLVLASLSACNTGPQNEGKMMPRLPVPSEARPITTQPVEIFSGDEKRQSLTGEKLASTPPDYSDDQRRAWRLETLTGADPATATYEITGRHGIVVTLKAGKDTGALIPALLLNQRGEALVVMLDPANPFPEYHGQGGRIERTNDPFIRIPAVTRIRVMTAEPAAP
ncbi:MAG: hypothetical protein KIT79_09305 [Deltaproteobacteria bacterium]|nr:hypothetical protein [Deltaproteobacteria bacterium]